MDYKFEIFKSKIVKRKYFKVLAKQYKSDKFIALYYRIYNYVLSISKDSKDKITLKKLYSENTEMKRWVENIIYKFLLAKDFYHWKDRIYKLMTQTKNGQNKTYEYYQLLYGSKADLFWTNTINKWKNNNTNTILERYGEENIFKSKEIIKKISNTRKNKSQEEKAKIQKKKEITCLEKYGKEYYTQTKEYKEQAKATNLKLYGKEYYTQTEEYKERNKETWKNKTQEEIKEIIKKRENTCLAKYNHKHPCLLNNRGLNSKNHSKIGDEICQVIDNALCNPEDSKYAIKNEEHYIKTKNGYIRKYDYCVPSLGIIVEVDDPYWHALDKYDNEIIKFPGDKLILAKEIHERDKEKEELAISKGYKVFHIIDIEYKKDPINTINKLLEEIREVI